MPRPLSRDQAAAIQWTLAFLSANQNDRLFECVKREPCEGPRLSAIEFPSGLQDPLSTSQILPPVDHLRKPPSSWRGNRGA